MTRVIFVSCKTAKTEYKFLALIVLPSNVSSLNDRKFRAFSPCFCYAVIYN